MMGVPTPTHPEDLDVNDATFHSPDLTTFARLDELGLVAVGQRLEPDRAVLECRVEARPEEAFCRLTALAEFPQSCSVKFLRSRG